MKKTLDKIKECRRDLDRIGKEIGTVRDLLENLLDDAAAELETVETAKESLDQLIDQLSERH